MFNHNQQNGNGFGLVHFTPNRPPPIINVAQVQPCYSHSVPPPTVERIQTIQPTYQPPYMPPGNYYDNPNLKTKIKQEYRYENMKNSCRSYDHSQDDYYSKYYTKPSVDGKSYRRERLPSPDSFIRECLSGVKSDERLNKEEIIRSFADRKRKMVEEPKSRKKPYVQPISQTQSISPLQPVSQMQPVFQKVRQNSDTEYLQKWRLNNCSTETEWQEEIEKIRNMDHAGLLRMEEQKWTRTSPADLYYTAMEENLKCLVATKKCKDLMNLFEETVVLRGERKRASLPIVDAPRRKLHIHLSDSDNSDGDSSGDECKKVEVDEEYNEQLEELKRKQNHPYRLHVELWHNEKGELNDGPHCRCSRKNRESGVRHNIYVGEENVFRCDQFSNNADKLYHYRITVSPATNFLITSPTVIKYDDHEFIFEGFSMLSHFPLEQLPACHTIRFNVQYTILYVEEKIPTNFTIRELDLFYKYFFVEILELYDFEPFPSQLKEADRGCPLFHFMPRFVRDLPEGGREILSMCHVIQYLMNNSDVLVREEELEEIQRITKEEWDDRIRSFRGSIVTKPGAKPSSVRIDQLDKEISIHPDNLYPDIIHFGIRPPQLGYVGSKKYQRLWRNYIKYKHLLANMAKPKMEDKRKLHEREMELTSLRTQSKFRRAVTVVTPSEGFYKTGIMCDMVQHALVLPVLSNFLRFHRSVDNLEANIGYKFKNRYLLQLSLTHPSYRENFGTNPDHVRNVLSNCGVRSPHFGNPRIHYMNSRKRGINMLMKIMAKFGTNSEQMSPILHNERLEFLGDAVIEYIATIHLFYLFPEVEEGGLATFRAAVVQNQHLTILAQRLQLDRYMLFAHGSDLCHEIELRHAMANCFEALMGALCLDGGVEVTNRVFSETIFKDRESLLNIWKNYPHHPLQMQEPDGDRKWIKTFPVLQKLTEFEKSIGIKFKHIRLLARAFSDRSLGFTNLTLGSNQRMEFLGDTILNLICSLYLYKHFPAHHEGHLSLLRSSLVNKKTQAVVCDDLGMAKYVCFGSQKEKLKTKDRADLLESFLGALYVDQGLDICTAFCEVCFFPRLQYFILKQEWNDPKSKLQQCCLTLRNMDGGDPDIPLYKVINCKGPTNGRTYTVAVYFRGKRLASAHGANIQDAEMNAAEKALASCKDLFPHLKYQENIINRTMRFCQIRNSESPTNSSGIL